MAKTTRRPFTILAINPGSTSTKVALFRDAVLFREAKLDCSREEIAACPRSADQVPLRTRHIEGFLREAGVDADALDAIAARGGPLKPVPGGVYRVDNAMLADALGDGYLDHVSRIACVIGHRLGAQAGVPVFTVDPVSTDEFLPVSRISGLKELPRKSLVHALNMKAMARHFAQKTGKRYEALNLITAQLGGGCSVAVHRRGRMIDSVDANGEGPFAPERAGGLRADDLAGFAAAGGLSASAVRRKLAGNGGLMSHLGTADAVEVERRIEAGDAEARLVYEAMAYATAKAVAGLAAAVDGKVDAIILTGGLARSSMLTKWIRKRVGFVAPVHVMPGEHEMQALAEGALRVLRGEERPRQYPK